MPERIRAEDVRRRLEGRVELLETARAHYAGLESLLASRRWRSRLRAKPELVSRWREQEPAITEALARTKRRAEVEGWPEDTPALVLARELTACRNRLEALARQRLARLAPVSGAPSLVEDLSRLDALVRRQETFLLNPGEVLVYEGARRSKASDRVPPLAVYLLLLNVVSVVAAVSLGKLLDVGEDGAPLLMLLLAGPWLAVALRSGRVRLTSERLLWEPTFGERVSVPLASIAPEGVRLEPATLTVQVEAQRRVELRHLNVAQDVATLLELHRQPPLKGAARAGVRLAEVALFPAVLRGRSGAPVRGQAVLRPGGVSFVPEEQGAEAFHAVTGQRTRLPVAPGLVLEQLCWLTDTEFDACVARMVEATGGLHWSAWDASYRPWLPVWKQIRITRGPLELSGHVDWARQEAAERLLRSWPQQER